MQLRFQQRLVREGNIYEGESVKDKTKRKTSRYFILLESGKPKFQFKGKGGPKPMAKASEPKRDAVRSKNRPPEHLLPWQYCRRHSGGRGSRGDISDNMDMLSGTSQTEEDKHCVLSLPRGI